MSGGGDVDVPDDHGEQAPVTPGLVVTGEPERLHFEAGTELAAMYLLSPFVWRAEGTWRVAVRAVPRSDNPQEKIARIHLGRSDDGVRFRLDDVAALPPGPELDDVAGCEDPTVVAGDGENLVFYSGWNESRQTGQLLYATAELDSDTFGKRGRVLPQQSPFENAKEASVVQVVDGTWRLFLEYARSGHSAIGIASSPSISGPWTPCVDPLFARHDMWDDTHLSPGPVITLNGHTFLVYNGANRHTQWRIGWAELDVTGTTVVRRCTEPLLTPPPPIGDATDIAFCSSAVHDGTNLWLYYTVSDKDCFRVSIDR